MRLATNLIQAAFAFVAAALLLLPKLAVVHYVNETLWGQIEPAGIVLVALQDIAVAAMVCAALLWLARYGRFVSLQLAMAVTGFLLLVLMMDARARELWLKPTDWSLVSYGIAHFRDLLSGVDLRGHAQLLGHAVTCEAFDMTAPERGGAGMARAMAKALQAARVAPDQVDYVSAHGTSMRPHDQCEAQAIKRTFGEHARGLWVSSQKSMIGHTIGAAGAIEIAVTALTIADGVVTPTINHTEPDLECDFDVVANEARERRVGVALSNSFGFGGHNCAVVLRAHGGH